MPFDIVYPPHPGLPRSERALRAQAGVKYMLTVTSFYPAVQPVFTQASKRRAMLTMLITSRKG